MDFAKELTGIFGEDRVRRNESMADHTSFRIGGPADYYVVPEDSASLASGIALCRQREIPFFILGNGTNLLVGDKGFRGVIFHLYKTMASITCLEEDGVMCVRAGAGALLSKVGKVVAEKGYAGFEFATGIPGSVGGAVMMNAGAYDGEIGNFLQYAIVLDENGNEQKLTLEDMDFGYRHSSVMDRGYIVLETCLKFEKGDRDAILERVEELLAKRKKSQPLDYPSAGSTFKRPEGYFAGKLIQDAGLKGFTVGGAQVSEKHAGFVINTGGATAADVRELIRQVQEKVFEQSGVMMEPEVRMIGEF
jgi:UDP-N-acetylmuramate dehydrogenase